MKTKDIDCLNGPITVSDSCLIETPRKVELRIGGNRRGEGRRAWLTLRQLSELIITLQEALGERLPEEPKRPVKAVMMPESSGAVVLH